MIWLRVVASPIRVTVTVSAPSPLTAPATTSSPPAFATGRDSPVKKASFMLEAPSTTSPSAGTCSPGRIRIVSPSTREATDTSWTDPSVRTRWAVDGTISARCSRAAPADRTDRISIQ